MIFRYRLQTVMKGRIIQSVYVVEGYAQHSWRVVTEDGEILSFENEADAEAKVKELNGEGQ